MEMEATYMFVGQESSNTTLFWMKWEPFTVCPYDKNWEIWDKSE